MNRLICYFDEKTPNECFRFIFNSIYNRFKIEYSAYEVGHLQPAISTASSSPGSGNFFQVINPENKKTIVMGFVDRGMDVLAKAYGWEDYDLVQYIGGIGMTLNSQEIGETYKVEHNPYQYPLDKLVTYDWIKQFREPYDPERKIKKAIFMGRLHNARIPLYELMHKHPLVEMDIYKGESDYIKTMSEYRMSLSLNGNGEVCLRDFESMGLNIPVIRSKMLTQMHNPLIPDVHYISATEPCLDAHCSYRNRDIKLIAEQFIDSIEKNIDDYDNLIKIANNGYEYFQNYENIDYIIDLYFKLININKLF